MNSKWMTTHVQLLLVALACLALTAAANNSLSERELQGRFNSWMRHHARSYDADEFLPRYNVWRENMAYIDEFNREEGRTFTLAMNEYGDLTSDQFASLYKGQRTSEDAQRDLQARLALEAEQSQPAARDTLPSSWDWRAQGAVTQVKNQGSCAACWAFTATGAVEGARAIAGGSLVSLSDQMLLDCAIGTGNLGCNGGNVEITYRWMLSNDALLMPESSYPYTARQSTCRYSAASGVQGIGNYVNVRAGSESDLLAKAAIGPVTVAIDASKRSFQFYAGGYYYESTCSTSYLDHAVLVVGWGTDATHGDYWLVKNQWGTSWGDAGYAYMARNRNNNCGIASLAVLPCMGATCPTAPNAQAGSDASPSPAASSLPAAPSATPAAPNSSPSSGTLPVAPSPAAASPASSSPAASSPAASPAAPSPSSAVAPTPASSPAAGTGGCYCQCGCGDGNPNNICFCPCACASA